MTQDGDKPEDSDDQSALPEIEAEIVDESAATTDSAFDDDGDQDPLETDEVAPATKSTLTPGVILFLVFALVALTAFGVWRLQMRSSGAETKADIPASVVESPVDQASEEVPKTPDGVGTVDAPEELVEDKIGNVEIDNLKRAPVPDQSEGESAANESFLPPVSSSNTGKLSNTVEEGAKEAMRRFQEAENAAGNDSSAQSPDENGPEQNSSSVSGFDIAPSPDVTPETQTPEDEKASSETSFSKLQNNQQTADVHESIANAAGASPALNGHVANNQTVQNDNAAVIVQSFEAEIARLNEALITERSRTNAQAREIETLRNDLSTALSARDEQVEQELSSMRALLEQAQNAGTNATSRQAQTSIALSALKRAVDQGAPFATELKAVSAYAPDAGAVLAAHAPKGVATESDLRARFGTAAKAAIIAARQEEAGGGVAGLVARATSIVTLWPSEPTAGDEPGAIISRAEHALERSDVGFALSQLDALPTSAKSAMAAWLAEARARAEVVAAITTLEAQLGVSVEQ